jgi:hypothetical protein
MEGGRPSIKNAGPAVVSITLSNEIAAAVIVAEDVSGKVSVHKIVSV